MYMTVHKTRKNISSLSVNNLGGKIRRQFPNGGNFTIPYSYICANNLLLKDNFST